MSIQLTCRSFRLLGKWDRAVLCASLSDRALACVLVRGAFGRSRSVPMYTSRAGSRGCAVDQVHESGSLSFSFLT